MQFYRPVNLQFKGRFIAIILFLIISLHISGQPLSSHWLSGYSSGTYTRFGGSNINFQSGWPDTIRVERNMDISIANANISDSTGNLLFYSNGIYIANANNDTMLNGSGLNPSAFTSNSYLGLNIQQGNLILPFPDHPTQYFLFHETLYYDQILNDYRSSELYYSKIDMSLDNQLGAVVEKNTILFSDTLTIGGITATRHANGRDWWIVVHKSFGQRYYTFLLSPIGVTGPYIQDIGYNIAPRDWVWQSCFSPDGSKFCTVFARDTIDVMEFDRCTGTFFNCTSLYLNDSAAARGCAFSPNSNILYVSSMFYIYQYNIISANIDSTKTIVSVWDGYADIFSPFSTPFFLSKLANDHKIYINTSNGTRYFTVINEPDSLGLICNVLQHGLALPTYNAFTIPNFPNFSLGRLIGSVCDSVYTNRSIPVEPRQLRLRAISDINSPLTRNSMELYSDRFRFKDFLLRLNLLVK